MNLISRHGMPWIVGVFATIILYGGATVDGQRVGERIVVTAKFDTKVKRTVVGRVYGGSIHSISEVQGKWCMVEGVPGWLPLQFTMNLESAQKIYEKRVSVNRDDYDAHAVLGMIAYENGRSSSALEYLNRALQLNSKVASIWNNRGIVLSDAGRYSSALSDYNQALKLNPDYASAYANRGLVQVALGKLEEAIADFSKAIELAPANPVHYKNRGSTYQSVGDFDQSLNDFNKAIQLDPGFDKAYIGRANVFLAIGKLEKARDNAREAVRLNPRSALAQNNLGWIYYQMEDFGKSMDHLTLALRLDTQMAIAYSNRGVVQVAQQKYDAGIRDFDRAIKLNSQSAVAFANRANAWIGKKEFVKAIKDFEMALKLAPTLGDALNGYAWFLATCPDGKFRDKVRSVKLIEQAIASEGSKNAEFLDTYAAALAESGEFEKAITQQKSAVALASEKNKQEYRQRLKSYEAGEPYRSDFGKR